MGLSGILVALFFLVWLAYRGGSVLLLAPAAALLAAAVAREPLLATWTQTFMGSAAQFVAQFFPIFLLGAVFGKLMEDSGSVSAIARFMTDKLGPGRAVLAVVLAGAFVTYGGVSLFVAFFVLAPMAEALFRTAGIPHRLMPAALALGTSTFTMSALPGTPAIQNAIPMPFFGTTPFAAPGLGVIASAIMLGFGLWWLKRAEAAARRKGEGYGRGASTETDAIKDATQNEIIRERATLAREFDPTELTHGRHSDESPPIVLATLPLVSVVCVNLVMSLFVLSRLDVSFLAEERWGSTSLAAVGGVWAVVVALAAVGVLHARQTREAANAAPQFQFDPTWPRQPFPNKWIVGNVIGVAVDPKDHIWILHRPSGLTDGEKAASLTPPAADCCIPAPPVIEFDQAGNLVQAGGGAGDGYTWSPPITRACPRVNPRNVQTSSHSGSLAVPQKILKRSSTRPRCGLRSGFSSGLICAFFSVAVARVAISSAFSA